MASSSSVLSQHYTRILGRGSSRDSSSPYPSETPVIILRVQIISCQDLEAKDRNGFSNPCVPLPLVTLRILLCLPSPPPRSFCLCSFVVVSVLGKRFQTPVCKRNLNPVYEPKDATFDFPIYTSLVHQLGTLEFAVWDKGLIRDDYLGEHSLPIDQWFIGTAFAFDDPSNQVRHFTTEDRTRDFNPSLSPSPAASFPYTQPQPCVGLFASNSALSTPPTRWVCPTSGKPTTH